MPRQQLTFDFDYDCLWDRNKQTGGDHYKTKAIQPWDYINANNLDFFEGNVIKYITRYKEKNGVEDLEKARDYLDFLIWRETNNEPLTLEEVDDE